MKRRVALILPLLLFTVSCGKVEKTSSSGTEAVSESTVSEGSSPESTPFAGKTAKGKNAEYQEQPPDENSAYRDLVEYYGSLVRDPSSYEEDEEAAYGVLETARGLGDDAADLMGYQIEDLSGDGIPEMAVGMLSGPVNAVYTLDDGKPFLVFEGWYRNTYLYMGNGYFCRSASDSAASGGYGVFYLSEDGKKLLCESFLFTALTEDGRLEVYSNNTGSWEPEESERSDMTLEDFWALDPAGEPMPLIPFSEGERNRADQGKGAEYPVTVRYLTQAKSDHCHWVTLYDGPDAACVLFTADSRVTDFTLLQLSAEDVTETGAILFQADPVVPERKESIPSVMTPDTPVAVQLLFPGDLPSFGISFVDENGRYRRFAIEVSGENGSLLLEEADPMETRFILPGTMSK